MYTRPTLSKRYRVIDRRKGLSGSSHPSRRDHALCAISGDDTQGVFSKTGETECENDSSLAGLAYPVISSSDRCVRRHCYIFGDFLAKVRGHFRSTDHHSDPRTDASFLSGRTPCKLGFAEKRSARKRHTCARQKAYPRLMRPNVFQLYKHKA